MEERPAQGKDTVRTRETSIGKAQDCQGHSQSMCADQTSHRRCQARHPEGSPAIHLEASPFAATENGTDQDIRMRGFPVATTGDLLIDGMRDPSQYDHATPSTSDRVEIMRGSASMIFGRNSTGGTRDQSGEQAAHAAGSNHELEAPSVPRGFFRTTADFQQSK